MAYTTIDDPTIYFNTLLYTGNSTARSLTGVGFQPDWVWIKSRSNTYHHQLYDSVRGATKGLNSNRTNSEETRSGLTSFGSDGFSLGTAGRENNNGDTKVAWNWLAGGTAPSQTYTVKVVSDSGNKYRFDDFGTSAVTLDLQEGGTYTFDQSDSSNSGHPLRFSTTSNGTHGGGSEYTTGVTTTGTPGSSGAKTVITVAASAPTLYYYCTQHSGMGGQANTNSTFGSSNFSGSFQSTVSANTTAGFSIVSFNGQTGTVGHALGIKPSMIILKCREIANNWVIQHKGLTGGMDSNALIFTNSAELSAPTAEPTTSVFTVNNQIAENNDNIAYIFADVKGYSKFGQYEGNANADGTFIHTGFLPAWVMVKNIDAAENWIIFDNKRSGYNLTDALLKPNLSNAESTSGVKFDLLSNGFKARVSDAEGNSSNTFIYMAFAESPFVNSKGVPNNAR